MFHWAIYTLNKTSPLFLTFTFIFHLVLLTNTSKGEKKAPKGGEELEFESGENLSP